MGLTMEEARAEAHFRRGRCARRAEEIDERLEDCERDELELRAAEGSQAAAEALEARGWPVPPLISERLSTDEGFEERIMDAHNAEMETVDDYGELTVEHLKDMAADGDSRAAEELDRRGIEPDMLEVDDNPIADDEMPALTAEQGAFIERVGEKFAGHEVVKLGPIGADMVLVTALDNPDHDQARGVKAWRVYGAGTVVETPIDVAGIAWDGRFFGGLTDHEKARVKRWAGTLVETELEGMSDPFGPRRVG